MKSLIIIILIVLSASFSGAEMYQWVADDGSVTFQDTPPPASKKRKKVKVYHDSDFAPAPPPQPVSTKRSSKRVTEESPTASATKKQSFNGNVEIYVTDWCGYCKQALSYMSSKGIPFTAYNIEKDSSAKQRHKELGGRGVPLIIIGSNKMSGFSAESLEYYLKNSN